jgi:hypothetical protein
MDPIECLRRLRAAMSESRFFDAVSHLENYTNWREHDGFEPAAGSVPNLPGSLPDVSGMTGDMYAAQVRTDIAAHYANVTSHPGQFENEPSYVPYFWDVYMNGGADRDDGSTLGFDVRPIDRAIFPDLKNRRTVKIRQRDDGFVVLG